MIRSRLSAFLTPLPFSTKLSNLPSIARRRRQITPFKTMSTVPQPAQTPAVMPAQTPVNELPAQTPVGEMPAQTPVGEMPAQTPVPQVPAQPPAQPKKRQPKPTPKPKPINRGNTLLLVGLGNPGRRYDKTRHNIGFQLIDEFARQNNVSFSTEKRFQAQVAKLQLHDHTIHIAKPQTFMNESGVTVNAIKRYYNIPSAGILILADDMSLDVGRIRLRGKGSAGGHNGLKSIQNKIGTNEYARLKIGVGSPHAGAEQWKDFVLGKFNRGEQDVLEDVSWDVMGALEHWVKEPDLNRVINQIAVAKQASKR